jgi:hypothetical protein
VATVVCDRKCKAVLLRWFLDFFFLIIHNTHINAYMYTCVCVCVRWGIGKEHL